MGLPQSCIWLAETGHFWYKSSVQAVNGSGLFLGDNGMANPLDNFIGAATRWLMCHAARTAGLLCMLVFFTAALAQPNRLAEEKSVREVIQGQLAAFAADDAEKAFSYAAPNIRSAFALATHFMATVRGQYAVVYRPASVAFLQLESLNEPNPSAEVVQRVQMTDANGVPWLAVYSLQRQKNNLWQITGCVVTNNNPRMV
jgi:Domain of unknown function (DUF4864)